MKETHVLFSNDSIEFSLSSNTPNLLHGPVGSPHKLEFILRNNFRDTHFTIE